MRDHRYESKLARAARFTWFAAAAVFALVLLAQAARMFGDPASALRRYRAPLDASHVFVRGTVRRAPGASLPALCAVQHERYGSCGKSRCWRGYESMSSSSAMVEVDWSSSPLPQQVGLSSSFRFDPRAPPMMVVSADRAAAWKEVAQRAGLGFSDASFRSPATDRIVEGCLDDGEQVFIEACVSPMSSAMLDRCPGLPAFGVVAGEPQIAIDAVADDVVMRVAGAFLALLVGLLPMARGSGPLADALENRAAPLRRRLGAAWALLGVLPVAGFLNLLLHASPRSSTWSVGRGGFALGLGVLALWLLFALSRRLARTRTLAALAPVLSTPRSLLAQASGTVELAVRARLRNGGLEPLIGDDVVAFSEVTIKETYKQGKSTGTTVWVVHRQCDELEVVDESGDGVLDLRHAVLDVELRKVTMPELSPRCAQLGITGVGRHPNHTNYVVEERVIRDGEPLYVFGDVSGIALRSTEHGYRTVRGAPTLGGSDLAPVLVHAGDERGLIATLATQARIANSLAVVAGCAVALLATALGYLASL